MWEERNMTNVFREEHRHLQSGDEPAIKQRDNRSEWGMFRGEESEAHKWELFWAQISELNYSPSRIVASSLNKEEDFCLLHRAQQVQMKSSQSNTQTMENTQPFYLLGPCPCYSLFKVFLSLEYILMWWAFESYFPSFIVVHNSYNTIFIIDAL